MALQGEKSPVFKVRLDVDAEAALDEVVRRFAAHGLSVSKASATRSALILFARHMATVFAAVPMPEKGEGDAGR